MEQSFNRLGQSENESSYQREFNPMPKTPVECEVNVFLRVLVEQALISPIVCEWKIHYVGNEVCMGCNPDGNLRGFPISG